jgi:hypothetical protein
MAIVSFEGMGAVPEVQWTKAEQAKTNSAVKVMAWK